MTPSNAKCDCPTMDGDIMHHSTCTVEKPWKSPYPTPTDRATGRACECPLKFTDAGAREHLLDCQEVRSKCGCGRLEPCPYHGVDPLAVPKFPRDTDKDQLIGVLQSFLSAWNDKVFVVGVDDEVFAESLVVRAETVLRRVGGL